MSIVPSLPTVSDPIPGPPTIPPVKYTSRDYQSILNDVIALIPSYLPEWTDRSPGDFGIVLIELFAYVGDILNYYSDRIANEAFLATAQQRQSVLNIANLLDYTPHNNVAATVNLQFTIASPSGPVVVPAGTLVSTTANGTQAVTFSTTQDLTVFGDDTHTVLPTITSNAAPNQQYLLGTPAHWLYPSPAYDGRTETVLVNGVAWTRAAGNTFVGQGSSAQVYIVTGGNTVQFGNGTNGLIPPINQPIVITYWAAPPGTYSGTVSAMHGAPVGGESLGISNGLANQIFRLFQTPVVDGSQVVYVDEGDGPAIWIAYQRMVDAFSTDQAYTTSTDANGVVSISFGDGITGRIPRAGAKITADYAVGGGSVGNVASNSLTALSSAVSGVLSVTNTSPASGGDDVETLDHIRIHAPLSITAINRAVALDDYAALVLNIPSIAKASAASTYYNTVNLYIHPAGNFTDIPTLTARVNALIPSITNSNWTGYLDNKKLVTVSVQVLPPQYHNNVTGITAAGYVPVDVTVTVQVLPQYHTSTVHDAVQTAIINLFRFAVVDFGVRISLSSIYHTVQEVPGVDYVNVSVLCRHESPGVGDVACLPYEIPQLNVNTVLVNGGITW